MRTRASTVILNTPRLLARTGAVKAITPAPPARAVGVHRAPRCSLAEAVSGSVCIATRKATNYAWAG